MFTNQIYYLLISNALPSDIRWDDEHDTVRWPFVDRLQLADKDRASLERYWTKQRTADYSNMSMFFIAPQQDWHVTIVHCLSLQLEISGQS